MVVFDREKSYFYSDYENARVIAKTGSGSDTEVVLYRGGIVPLAGGTYGYPAGARDYSGIPAENKRIVAYMNHPDSGSYQANFIDYINHPVDSGGNEYLMGFGHGSRTRIGVAGAHPTAPQYGVMFGGWEKQKTQTEADEHFRLRRENAEQHHEH